MTFLVVTFFVKLQAESIVELTRWLAFHVAKFQIDLNICECCPCDVIGLEPTLKQRK